MINLNNRTYNSLQDMLSDMTESEAEITRTEATQDDRIKTEFKNSKIIIIKRFDEIINWLEEGRT